MADLAPDAKVEAGKEVEAAGGKEVEAASGKEEVDLNKRKRRRGVLSFIGGVLRGIWRVAFGGRREDLGKRLEFLTKEEEAVHGRVKRRAQWWRATARNIIVFSVLLEIAAVVYAVVVTRSLELSWQMRAVRVLPMFATPGLSYVIYSTIATFTRMRDRKDQKTLEKLRAERQAKIDELKEKTNYYSTQQLIQRYDLDPAAKAAAATVLASKLGADSGLKVSLGDEAKLDSSSGKSNDVKLVSTDGLRNRKQSNARNHTAGNSPVHQLASEASQVTDLNGSDASNLDRRVVEHYRGSGSNDGGWISRIAALLVGEDPTQSYALICGNCHMHNGLSRKEDFPYITYYCPHCHALNGPQQPEGHNIGSGSISGNSSPPASSGENINPNSSGASSAVPGVEVGAVQGEHAEVSKEKEPDVQR